MRLTVRIVLDVCATAQKNWIPPKHCVKRSEQIIQVSRVIRRASKPASGPRLGSRFLGIAYEREILI